MSNLTIENVYTRHKAKELTKQYFWKLLAMSAISLGIPYALSLGGTALLSVLAAEESGFFIVGSLLLVLVVTLLASGLMLGLLNAMIRLCRSDAPVPVNTVFSRMGLCLKGFGQSLWVGLKTFLWALPVYVPLFFVTGAILVAGDPHTMQASESTQAILMILPFIALITTFALVIPAAFRYIMAPYLLADKPDTGVFESVRQSKAMMKGHKWQAFKLVVPLLLIMYAMLFIIIVIMGAATTLLASTAAAATVLSIVTMVLMLVAVVYYQIRMYLCYVLFYLKRTFEQAPAEEAKADPVTETDEEASAE